MLNAQAFNDPKGLSKTIRDRRRDRRVEKARQDDGEYGAFLELMKMNGHEVQK